MCRDKQGQDIADAKPTTTAATTCLAKIVRPQPYRVLKVPARQSACSVLFDVVRRPLIGGRPNQGVAEAVEGRGCCERGAGIPSKVHRKCQTYDGKSIAGVRKRGGINWTELSVKFIFLLSMATHVVQPTHVVVPSG